MTPRSESFSALAEAEYPAPLALDEPADERRPVAPAIFELLLRFNLFPASYAHPSWISGMGFAAPACNIDAYSPFWLRSLSEALLRARGLESQFDVDFSDRAKRLALLDAPTLVRIGNLVAAVLVRERLCQIVRGSQVDALHQAIGVDGRQIAMRWDGELPRLPAPVHQLGDAVPDAQAWTLRGMILLMSVMPETALAVFGRLQFKFPQHWARVRKIRLRLDETERAGLMRLFVAMITRESKQWRWLFDPSASTPTPPGAPLQ